MNKKLVAADLPNSSDGMVFNILIKLKTLIRKRLRNTQKALCTGITSKDEFFRSINSQVFFLDSHRTMLASNIMCLLVYT